MTNLIGLGQKFHTYPAAPL